MNTSCLRKAWHLSLVCATAVSISIASPTTAHAMAVEYKVAPLGGDSWRYDYTITNIGLPATFDELTVYFDVTKYELLSNGISPSGWDPIVVQPDAGLPSNGFYDALSLIGAPGDESLAGFSVSFVYLDAGTPGAQPFELINSFDFSVVQSGTTQLPGPVVVVPEPSTLSLLLLAGLLFLVSALSGQAREKSRSQTRAHYALS